MNTKQILFTIAIIAAISPATVVAPVMAQNMTGGNMTGGNMTGKISDWRHLTPQEAAKCTPPEVEVSEGKSEVEVSEGKCGIDQSRQGDGSADSAAATAADDDDGGDTNSGDGGDTDSGDGGGQDQSEDDEEQKEG